MKKLFNGWVALTLCWTHLTAQEQDSLRIEQLDEVVLTDSRFALKRENSGKTVVKITEEELVRNQGRTVAELINTKTGFELNGSRSNAGQNISAFVRGGNNRQVLVVVDGIQVSDPSNVSAEFDLRLLDISQIASIEILKGAASTLYGNSAATAVINITTKKPKKEGFGVQVNSSFGTNQSQEDQDYRVEDFSNSATVSFRRNKVSLSGGIGNQNTNGLSAAIGEESDEFNRVNANISLGYAISEKWNGTITMYYDELRNDFDNGFPVEDANFNSKSEQFRYTLSTTYKYKNGSTHLNAAFNKIDRRFVSDFPSEFDSESLVFDVFNKYVLSDKWHTILGFNLIDQRTSFTEEFNATTADPYANVVYVSDFGLNLNFGGRWNNHSEYGSNWVYNFNPSYSMGVREGYLKFFGSYATSFIAPSLSQLFGQFGPNPNLEPEENRTFEGGAELRLNKVLRLSALFFDRTEENGIDFVIIDPDTFEGQYQNVIPENNTYGLEVELATNVLKDAAITANYAFTERDEGLALRIPKHKLNAQLDYSITKKWLTSASFQWVSSRQDVDFSSFENVELEAYNLFGLYSRYQFSKHWSAFINVENLFNTDYFEILNFTTRGRNLRVGFRYQI